MLTLGQETRVLPPEVIWGDGLDRPDPSLINKKGLIIAIDSGDGESEYGCSLEDPIYLVRFFAPDVPAQSWLWGEELEEVTT